jgi:heme-degrading monooxygenase HmoA
MAVIEVVTFRLAPDADPDAFMDADRRAQTEFAYRQTGLQRRTTARGTGDEWVVVTVWESAHAADAAAAASHHDPAATALADHLDASSVTTARYATLD